MAGRIHVRPARPEDRQAMLEITRNVWEGTDYVPYVWERWLSSSDGSLSVAALSGRVVGLQHVERHPDGSAWLEGIRVAEDVRGYGVGKALLEHGIAWARSSGCSIARLSTSTSNAASGRLAQRAGFSIIEERVPLTAEPSAVERNFEGVRLALPSDVEDVSRFLHLFPNSTGEHTFYTEGWTAYRLTQQRLHLLLASGAVILYGTDSIEGMAIATCATPFSRLRIGLLEGESAAIAILACWLRVRSYQAGLSDVRATVKLDEDGLRHVEEAGYTQRPGFSLLVHERRFSEGEAG